MKEIFNQINELLKPHIATQEERNEFISNMGEVIVSESLVETIEAIVDLDIRAKFVEAVNASDIDKAYALADQSGVDIGAIIEKKSKEMIDDVVNL